MDNNEIFNIILKDTFSLAQFKHRLRLLKSNLLKNFFGTQDESLPLYAQDLSWLKSLPATFYEKFNKDNVYEILSNLEKQASNLPLLTMYLTFEPDEVVLSQIGSFCRNKFGPNLLLDIKLNPNLIAGTALAWKGILHDYSLRAKIEERKTEISQGFKKFLR